MIKKIFLKIIYLPFLFPIIYQIKFPIKTIGSINLLDLVLIISITLGIILIVKENRTRDFKNYLIKNKLIRGIGFFLLFGMFSLSINYESNFIRGLGLLKSFFVLPVLFAIIVHYFYQKKQINFWLFLQCLFVYSIFLSCLTIFLKIINYTTFDHRVRFFFDSPNQLAVPLALGIISGILLQRHQILKTTSFLILFLIPALLLTQSTGAILAVSMIMFFIFAQKKLPNQKLILRYFLFLSLMIILLLPILPFFLDKINYNPFLNQSSSDSRLAIYLSTQKIISNHFINGIGLANFQEKYLENQKIFSPYPQWAVPHSHNLFAQIWLSFGILGLIAWSYCLYKKTLPNQDVLRKVSLYFILYFLIHGLIDVPIWNNDQALFFWFIFFF